MNVYLMLDTELSLDSEDIHEISWTHHWYFSPLAEETLDTALPPAVLEADQSISEPAGGKDGDNAAPAGTNAAPTAETEDSSEQTSSGAVLITDFETVSYCKKSPAAS